MIRRDHDPPAAARHEAERVPARAPQPGAPAPALLAQLRDAPAAAAAPAATPEQEFDAAVQRGGWDSAAHAIVGVAKPVDRLILLTVDQLRPLQDELVRRADKLGADAAHILGHIDLVLQTKGVDPAKTAPGTTYGTLSWTESPLIHGDRAKTRRYRTASRSGRSTSPPGPDQTVIDGQRHDARARSRARREGG